MKSGDPAPEGRRSRQPAADKRPRRNAAWLEVAGMTPVEMLDEIRRRDEIVAGDQVVIKLLHEENKRLRAALLQIRDGGFDPWGTAWDALEGK